MTLKDDIEAAHGMRDLWVQEGGDPEAAERVITLAERAANPAMQALLDACEAVPLRKADGPPYILSSDSSPLARAIACWRAAKAEGFVPAVERSGGPTSAGAYANLRVAAEAVESASDHDDLAIKAGALARLVLALFTPVEEMGPDV